ncbi:hypothetical protein [Anaerolentibacter hominis]|uniref:hypothetical protein n=1 Tax=Anaerolentibacter hominis TaxID=3079009 RepID=UPI0031B7F833
MKDMLPDTLIEWSAAGSGKVNTDWASEDKRRFLMIDDADVSAEVLYIGGGNAFVIYRDESVYNQVSRQFAIKVTEECQGITVLTTSTEVHLKDFPGDIECLNQKMGQLKKKVRRELTVSAYPVIEQDLHDGFPITRRMVQNGSTADMSEIRYEKYMANAGKTDGDTQWSYAHEMEELAAEKGVDSYVAVIHIDGNGMGEMVHSIMKKNQTYEKAIPAMRKFSADIAEKNQEAQNAMVDIFRMIYDKNSLPLRPLIMDGDDMTYICCAQAGIASAVFYLRKLMVLSNENLRLSSCAGIAFVHNHFPFSIAYEIAETCCARAKRCWYEDKNEKNTAGYLDYYVVQDAYVKGMKEERQKELRVRPYWVSEKNDLNKTNSVDGLLATLTQMKGETGVSEGWPMNRLHHLYEAYISGTLETLKQEYASRGYELSKLCGISDHSVCEEEAGIFDALEIMDFYRGDVWSKFWDESERGGNQ